MLLTTGAKKATQKNGKKASQPKEEESIFGQVLSVFGLPVERNIIFSNHRNAYRKKIEKRQRKLIVKISFLKFFLHSEENILLLTTAYSPITFWELLLTFPTFIFFRRALLVFTNKRIFHVPATFRFSYRQTISQIPYTDCHKLAVKGRSLVMDLKNGEHEVYSNIGAMELKKIKYLIGHLPINDTLNPDIAIHSLCPSCSNPLPEEPKKCLKCQLTFKDKNKAVLRSILLPGGGLLYSRHAIYGALMALIEIVIIYSITIASLNLMREYSKNNLFLLIFMAIVLISVKAINAFQTGVLLCYPIPEKTDFERRKM